MRSLDQFARDKLAQRETEHLRRSLIESVPLEGAIERDGRRLLDFSSNDYLDLTQHPALKQAAIAAIERYGTGAGASRSVTGNHPLYAELEGRLARLKGTQAACVFGSGYLANTGIIPALVGRDDLVVADEFTHSCLRAGAQMSGAAVALFRHNDVAHARELLERERGKHGRALIVTEGVFSMDGDLAPLHELAALAQDHDAWLLCDDAHGFGVLGGGRGTAFIGPQPPAIPLQIGTLSKALGGYGGYLCASRPVIELMHNRARTLIYSTGLPPAIIAAAIAAIDLIENDPDYAELPLRHAKLFTRAAGLKEAASPIVPLMIGDADATLHASRLLEDAGFLVVAIRPPTVPAGSARLRFTFSAAHRRADIERLAQIVRTRILVPA